EFSGRSGKSWRARHGISNDQVAILSPRQWIPNSNIPLIIEAFAQVRRHRANVVLILKHRENTPAVLREQIEAQIRASGTSDAIVHVGDVQEMELPDLYAASDITVSVCSSDGTPVSLLEAMAGHSAVVMATCRASVSGSRTAKQAFSFL